MKKEKGTHYIKFAILAFVGICLELVLAYLIEPSIYQLSMNDWETCHYITHWILTCCIWGVVGALICHRAKFALGFDILAKGTKIKAWQWIVIIVVIALSFLTSYFDWNGFKIIIEYQNLGPLEFVFQYLYYAFEILLVTLILVFGQKACELWFHKANIPYGGIIIAATWGIGHFFSKDMLTGILCVIIGLAFGAAYLLTNRDIKKTYCILLIMFII